MDIKEFSLILDEVDALTVITARRDDGRDDVFRIAMGPFPARISYRGSLPILLDVVIGEVEAGADVEGAVRRIPFPKPSVELTLQPIMLVSITYGAEPGTFSQEEAIGICAAGAMFGVTLAQNLLPSMTVQWQERVAAHVNARLRDPRDILRGSEIPAWSQWPEPRS